MAVMRVELGKFMATKNDMKCKVYFCRLKGGYGLGLRQFAA